MKPNVPVIYFIHLPGQDKLQLENMIDVLDRETPD